MLTNLSHPMYIKSIFRIFQCYMLFVNPAANGEGSCPCISENSHLPNSDKYLRRGLKHLSFLEITSMAWPNPVFILSIMKTRLD